MIETVITPREGMKLLVRSSKGGQEEYSVDAVEVVSFGQSLFFRSSERPKSFLVPVSDYEILELKEVRAPLKAASPERSIKIGGGKEPQRREPVPPMPEEREPLPFPSDNNGYERGDQRKGKRRRGRRGGGRHDSAPYDMAPPQSAPQPLPSEEGQPFATGAVEEQKAPSFISKLFPPPPTLIKETLSRYKATLPPLDEEISIEERLEEEILEFPEALPTDEDLGEDEN